MFSGYTALHMAATAGNSAVGLEMLEKGEKELLFIGECNGKSACHTAAAN